MPSYFAHHLLGFALLMPGARQNPVIEMIILGLFQNRQNLAAGKVKFFIVEFSLFLFSEMLLQLAIFFRGDRHIKLTP